MVLHFFPSCTLDWAESAPEEEIFAWYKKAIDLHAKETSSLLNAIGSGEYKSPYIE